MCIKENYNIFMLKQETPPCPYSPEPGLRFPMHIAYAVQPRFWLVPEFACQWIVYPSQFHVMSTFDPSLCK